MTDRPALIVTGVGAHADPWHDLPSTSTALAEVLAERMPVHHLDTDEITDEITDGGTLKEAALIVVNISADLATQPAAASAVLDPLLDAVAAGIPLLAVHSSSLAFRDDPRWAEVLGGRWVPGVTMHPQIGWSLVQPTAPLSPFRVYDERYSHLEVGDGSALRAIHTDDGIAHALAWSRRGVDGHGAVAYAALGHGVEAYRSAGMRALLHALTDELLGTAHTAIETPDDSAASRDLEASALDYELIALAPRGSDVATTGFADRFDDGELLASGYLTVERLPTGGVALRSHGREIGRVAPVDGGLRADLPGAEIDGRMLRAAEAGVVLVAESGDWRSDGAGSAFVLAEDWRVVVVHGPASVKLDNRVRLLDDLRAVRETQREQHA